MTNAQKCQECGAKMKLCKAALPERGSGFVGDDMWECPKCHHVKNAEAPEESP